MNDLRVIINLYQDDFGAPLGRVKPTGPA